VSKTWFITGTSRGFGRIWADAALRRGDRVAATARDVRSIADLGRGESEDRLLRLPLDVTDKPACDAAVQRAHAHFDTLDVLVNNAAFGLYGAVEEVSAEQARAQLETNFFGALWVTKAALPLLREQGHGHIVQVSSVGGVQAWPNLGLYNASKWALEGMSQSLAAEVLPLGLKVTLIEPTGYATGDGPAYAVEADPIPAYRRTQVESPEDEPARGDPAATVAALFRIVDSQEPPLRVFLGEGPLDELRAEYASRLELWERWNPLSAAAWRMTA
jgi:NAD(P)-dependent dehydrogenase (short-subunit alcohol dehydrogenase family)